METLSGEVLQILAERFKLLANPTRLAILQHICENGYEHHVAASRSEVSHAVAEAFSKYMGWSVYHHAA